MWGMMSSRFGYALTRLNLYESCGAFAALLLVVAALPRAASGQELVPLEGWRFEQPITTLQAEKAEDVQHYFSTRNYTLERVVKHGAIPRLYVEALPTGLKSMQPPKDREAHFIQIVLPLVARANETILAQRKQLESFIEITGKGGKLSDSQQSWLDNLAQLYGADPTDHDELRVRVDVVPPALAIAQAIDESGWGTAHLAREANNLFGQHAPLQNKATVKAKKADVGVASFPHLLDSVMSYMLNLNSHRAYAELRSIRAKLRQEDKPPDGHALSMGLRHYSTRGMRYVRDLRNLMRWHELSKFDGISLASQGGATKIEVQKTSKAQSK